MRKGRFTEEQMVAIIRKADREPVSAVAKRHGVSEQTIYNWRKRFGGLQATDVRRLRQLERSPTETRLAAGDMGSRRPLPTDEDSSRLRAGIPWRLLFFSDDPL